MGRARLRAKKEEEVEAERKEIDKMGADADGNMEVDKVRKEVDIMGADADGNMEVDKVGGGPEWALENLDRI